MRHLTHALRLVSILYLDKLFDFICFIFHAKLHSFIMRQILSWLKKATHFLTKCCYILIEFSLKKQGRSYLTVHGLNITFFNGNYFAKCWLKFQLSYLGNVAQRRNSSGMHYTTSIWHFIFIGVFRMIVIINRMNNSQIEQ